MEFTLEQLKAMASKLDMKVHHNISAKKLQEQVEAKLEAREQSIEDLADSLGFIEALKKPVEVPVNPILGKPMLEPKQTAVGDSSPISVDVLQSKATESLDMDEIARLSKVTFKEVDADEAKKEENEQLRDALRLIRCIITCNNRNKTSYQGEIFCARNAVLPDVKKFVPFGVPTHVPVILYNMIKEKQYQMFRREKSTDNRPAVVKTYLTPEYNIQDLPPLTKDELEAIRKKQLAEGMGKE